MGNLTSERKIGLGMFTQYYIFKFIIEKEPEPPQLLKFIDRNSYELYPPTGFSFSKYLNELLADNYISKDEKGKIYVTSKGKMEYDEIARNENQIKKYENTLNLSE